MGEQRHSAAHTECTCILSASRIGLLAPGEPIGSRTIDIWLSLSALLVLTAPMAHCPLVHTGSSSTYKREVGFRVATRGQAITGSSHQRADACSLPVVPRQIEVVAERAHPQRASLSTKDFSATRKSSNQRGVHLHACSSDGNIQSGSLWMVWPKVS